MRQQAPAALAAAVLRTGRFGLRLQLRSVDIAFETMSEIAFETMSEQEGPNVERAGKAAKQDETQETLTYIFCFCKNK